MVSEKINEVVNNLWHGAINEEEFDKNKFSFSPKEVSEAISIASENQDIELLGKTFFVAFSFDLFDDRHIDCLKSLLLFNWHREHEDIIGLFQRKFNTDNSVINILIQAIETIPQYIIDNEDKYIYLRKIVYALGYQPFPHNQKALTSLLSTYDEEFKALVEHQLAKKYCKG